MRLRVEILIDLEAADFVDAATHQRRLEEIMISLKGEYPSANMTIKERKVRTSSRYIAPVSRRLLQTGQMHEYVE